jgi:hypothetical protein
MTIEGKSDVSGQNKDALGSKTGGRCADWRKWVDIELIRPVCVAIPGMTPNNIHRIAETFKQIHPF